MGGQWDQKFAITHLFSQRGAQVETVAQPSPMTLMGVELFAQHRIIQGDESLFSPWLPSPLCSIALQLASVFLLFLFNASTS